MSTPTMPTVEQPRAGSRTITDYVAAVRRHLDDLGPEEVDDLTGGLEADLTDALDTEPGGPDEVFGPPEAYADELRSAAGLAPRRQPSRRSDGLTRRWLVATRDRVRTVQQQAWWPALRDFVVTLRPVWWLLRAYVAYQLGYFLWAGRPRNLPVVPYNATTWFLLVLFAVVSVEIGRRGLGRGHRAWHILIVAGNAVTVLILLLSLVGHGLPWSGTSSRGSAEPATMWISPVEASLYGVVNVFPYDANGKPLRDVQLFDDRGRPVLLEQTAYVGRNNERIRTVPGRTVDGRSVRNVYPAREQVVDPGYDKNGDAVPLPVTGPVRNPRLPIASPAAIVPLEVPSGPATVQPTPSGR